MSDLYHKVSNSPVGRSVVSALNLPAPVVLERQNRTDAPFLEGEVLLSGAPGGAALETICTVLGASTASLFALDAKPLVAASDIKTKTKVSALKADAIDPKQRFKALVFDATGITTTEQLKTVYEFFHPVIRNVAKCGRIVIVGTEPSACATPAMAASQKALEGFIRSVAKETGKKGITAQVIYATPGAENQIESPLRFCLSPRSAYVSGQTLSVSKATKSKAAFDWSSPLKGKVALVTGASRGIGEAIAKTLARDGATVVCLDVPQANEALESVAASIGGSALALDITAPEAPEVISSHFQKEHGGLDIIVHNAGVTRDKTLGRMPEHFWDMLIDINLSSEERINDALFANEVFNKNARIVCVSSISGIAGNVGQSNYAASKSGVIGYVESLSKQLKGGVTINAVAPGFIETQMTAAIPFMIREAGRRMNSLNQGGQPEDVAEAIAFFSSPASQGVNGNILRVCGQSLIGK
ncbi:3-oxoacyl-ACP reductase [Alkalimarinus sediminis]|uniref:3-oxoacyl-ACP reductase n=1 Tax=Alkalimarinus sediminis TaxID=1632866 RepID=A0A9E8KPC6_9ALTE|nr:3-oxoacyl-ACP reductase [Alkalimarinus sediminis]UZW73342.1 3-oxoacyl-ACP reductase [Alkalimarinus sediminis]